MHPETLAPNTHKLLDLLGKTSVAKQFYLAGGTALALHYGHRRSIDLDWFSNKEFSVPRLRDKLAAGSGELTVVAEDKGTLHGVMNRVRLSFLYYPYKLLWPTIKYNGVNLADPRDIACMKLLAISNRGSKKDFFDLYILLKYYQLAQLFVWFDRKFSGTRYNHLHLLKSLLYFDDAEKEPNPVLLCNLTWREVKRQFKLAVSQYLKQI